MTPRRAIRAAAMLLTLALGSGACGGPRDRAPAARFAGGGLEIELAIDPLRPREGANRWRVRVRDGSGAPVDDVEIELRAQMEMAGMAPMQSGARATPIGDGLYEADLVLEMAGSWQLAIEARRGGTALARAQGSLTTGVPGLRLAGGPDASAGAPGAAAAASDAPAGRVPASERGARPAAVEVHLAPERMQQIGIRSVPVAEAPFDRVIRAVGRVTWDESALVDVALKVRGWATKLEADALGMRVERGRPLLWLYSPELYAAQQELLSALESQRGSNGQRSGAIVRAARQRLRLWGLADADIDALARRGDVAEALPIRSPASGIVIEKDVTLGAAIEPGRRLFRIAPLDRVWIEAELQEDELEGVAPGDGAVVTLPSLPGRRFEAKLAFVYPYLESGSRSARARLVLENADLALRPDMYANVALRVTQGERLLVPVSAVLYAGPRRLVFVDLGEGRLQAREITLGAGNGESHTVLAGLAPGERVVVSGNFLVAAESRLQSALDAW